MKLSFEHIYDSYMLNQIKFHKLDVVVDCGANVGELYLAFQNKNIEISYFELSQIRMLFLFK